MNHIEQRLLYSLLLTGVFFAAALGCSAKKPAEVFDEVLVSELKFADSIFSQAKLPDVPFAEKANSNQPSVRVLVTRDRIYVDNTRWLAALPDHERHAVFLRALAESERKTAICSRWTTINDITDTNSWSQNAELNHIKLVAKILAELFENRDADTHTDLYFSDDVSYQRITHVRRWLTLRDQNIVIRSEGDVANLLVVINLGHPSYMGGEWPLSVKDRCGQDGKKCCVEPHLKITELGLFADYRHVRLFDPKSPDSSREHSSTLEDPWIHTRRLIRDHPLNPSVRRSDESVDANELSDVESFFREIDFPLCPHVNLSAEPSTPWGYLSRVVSLVNSEFHPQNVYFSFNGSAVEQVPDLSEKQLKNQPVFEDVQQKGGSSETSFKVVKVGFGGDTMRPAGGAVLRTRCRKHRDQ